MQKLEKQTISRIWKLLQLAFFSFFVTYILKENPHNAIIYACLPYERLCLLGFKKTKKYLNWS